MANMNTKKKYAQKNDPNASLEAQKYEEPIASREWILSLLTDLKRPLSKEELVEELRIKKDSAIDALHRRLRAMVRDGQLVCSKKGLYAPCPDLHEVTGKIELVDGQSFVKAPDGTRVYLHEKQCKSAFPGDTAIIKITNLDSNDRYLGQVLEVLERHTKQVIGRLNEDHGIFYVVPENQYLSHRILILPGDHGTARKGDIVVCEITLQPTYHTQAIGKILSVLGEAIDVKTAIHAAIDAFNIPNEFKEDIDKELAKFPDDLIKVDLEDLKNRRDIRHLPIVTIDGADARDFDDAVYCEKLRLGGWKLWVAIADVSHYVKAGGALDKEAEIRGNSVYFPSQVVPMLPEKLSNGLCSLKPKVDRLCLVCEMRISKAGKLTKHEFYPAVMHSHARFTYDQVFEILTAPHTPLHQEYAHLLPGLYELYYLYKALKNGRIERGALDFETIETKIIFDESGRISEFGSYTRNEAHCLIEECMLVANIAAAKSLEKFNQGGIYRIHEGPKPEKVEDLRVFLKLSRIPFSAKGLPSTKDLAEVLKLSKDRPDSKVIQTMVLRSMNQAVYSPENLGHFGLAFDAYAHFTSPIRRYPDLIVHRLLKAGLNKEDRNISGGVLYGPGSLSEISEHSSMTERRADEATRDVTGALKCAYMKQHIGEVFGGVISGVTNFGFFVTLNTMPVDGLVHVTNLHDDYYHYDSGSQTLIGERRRRVFRLGDALKVRLTRVDIAGRKIDFECV